MSHAAHVCSLLPTKLPLHTHAHTHLIAGPALEAVGVELVDVENMDGTLDAEVM